MSVQEPLGPLGMDPGAMFTYLTEWAAQFHDSSSPAEVTDVLLSFAFLVGVNLGAANPPVSAAFLQRLEEEMPSASQRARLLALAMLHPSAGSSIGKTAS